MRAIETEISVALRVHVAWDGIYLLYVDTNSQSLNTAKLIALRQRPR